MRDRGMVLLAVVAAALVWIGVSAQQQEMLPRPGPGSGIVDVRGTVSIANVPGVTVTNIPSVHVTNTPSVAVTNTPSVTVTGPSFLAKGGRYTITWPSGETEEITVTATGQGGGWVRVADTRGSRWVNIDAALSVEQQAR